MADRRRLSWGSALLALTLAATPAGAGELLVSAAASLTNAVGEIAAAFEAAKVICNFAGSGTLLRQLERGAPVDVLLTADPATMDRARDAGLLRPEPPGVFAGNTLVLITPPKPAGTVHSSGALLSGGGLLAVGNPKFVPAGRYAREALGSEYWARMEGRLVLGNSVRQVLDYVARGEVDAGVVYATDAAAAGDRVRVAVHLRGHRPILYAAAVLANSAQAQLAERFTTFLVTAPGQRILARHGFTPPPSAVAGLPALTVGH
jgi:molybdate transport system substrate-binding protein